MRVPKAPKPGDVLHLILDGQHIAVSVDSWSDGHLAATTLDYVDEGHAPEPIGTMQRSAEDFEHDVTKPKRKRAASTAKPKGTGKTPPKKS